MSIDRQTVMMVTNLLVGSLGGLATAFILGIATVNGAKKAMFVGAVGFSVLALVLQMTRITRMFGIAIAFVQFMGG